MSPKVSIIVPVHNAQATLSRCVSSILHQEYTDFELLLIDDGSTDASGALCDEFVSQDGRVTVIHKENSGVSDTRNLALSKAEGIYLQFVDSDDWIEPDMYEVLYYAAEKFHVDYVKGDYKKFFALDNGEYLYSVIKQFEDEDISLYGKTLNPHTFDYLYKTDFKVMN